MGFQLSQSGTVAVPAGVDSLNVTGLNLPFTPTGVNVVLRKPRAEAYNILATPVSELEADGFVVHFSADTEEEGYRLDWIAWATSTPFDTDGTLQVSYGQLCETVARFLGYDPGNLADDQTAEVDSYVQAGVRSFYFPPAVNGIEAGYEWSFLRAVGTLTATKDVSIAAVPDNLARIMGDFYFEPQEYLPSIVQVTEHRVMQEHQRDPQVGRPRIFAARFTQSYGAHGQVQEVIFWPTPDKDYRLTYRFEAYTGRLSDLNPCPLGGTRYSELVTESCLAVAEQRANDERGLHTERFMELLAAGIETDRRNSARNYGFMGGSPEGGGTPCAGRIRPGVLYNGRPV